MSSAISVKASITELRAEESASMKNSIRAKNDSPSLTDGIRKRVVACGISIFLAAAWHGENKQPQSMDSYLKESSDAGKESSRLMLGGPEITAVDSIPDRMS